MCIFRKRHADSANITLSLSDGLSFKITLTGNGNAEIGCLEITISHYLLNDENVTVGKINMFKVEPPYQNQGYGRVLINSSLPYLQLKGANKLLVEPSPFLNSGEEPRIAQTELRSKYSHFGFRQASNEEMDKFLWHPKSGHILMVLDLDEK